MKPRRQAVWLALLGAVLVSILLNVPGATARQLVTHSFSSSFDGHASSAGPFGEGIAAIATDETSGAVYALTGNFTVDKFDANGNPSAFTAPSLGGANSLTVIPEEERLLRGLRIYVDNSQTATQGRIYVLDSDYPFSNLYVFESSGAPVPGLQPLYLPSVTDLAIDPSTGNFWATFNLGYPRRYTSAGVPTEEPVPPVEARRSAIDSHGNVYLHEELGLEQIPGLSKYDQAQHFQFALPVGYEFVVDPLSDDLYAVDPSGVAQYSEAGERVAHFGASGDAIVVNGSNGNVYVADREEKKVNIYAPGATATVPDVTTDPASDFHATSVELHGTVNPDGQETTSCQFSWSLDESLENSATCTEGNGINGSTPQQVTATLSSLKQGQTYHFRFEAASANGEVLGLEKTFIPSAKPSSGSQWATDVHSDSVILHADINPEGALTSYRFQYGNEDCAVSVCSQSAAEEIGTGLEAGTHSRFIGGLKPGTTYHYRLAATNQSGTYYGPDRTFTTFPQTKILIDSCANAHVRQQVGAALLPDCRAYELVSAADTGGYNVESDIVPGQHPFGGYPEASERVLYGVHSGAIPGPWNATNHGVDPYLATRGEEGWTTSYVGIPADDPYSNSPFASPLDEANPFLTAFAFGGEDLCSPCFEDGSTGIPLRQSGGSLEQGMTGTEGTVAAATSDGLVKKRFSADGDHLVFGSTSLFAPGGNDETDDVSIYDRDLTTGDTQVVSTDPSGEPLECLQGTGECHSPTDGAGIAELDISKDGSRIVVGQLISTDAKGNHYFHLYMHIGDDPETIDLTPGTTTGVQYDGMTEDGTMVYFTTVDQLTTSSNQDTDSSADIFRADVSSSGATLTRVSTGEGGTGNTDECEPAGTPDSWNTSVGEGKCSALAFAGGAGVVATRGDLYFISPEKLDTSNPQHEPLQNQPNLYLSRPGSPPHFVATVDSSEGKSPPPPTRPLKNPPLVTGLAEPQRLAVDQSNGDLYVIEKEGEDLARYMENGAPDNFSVPGGSNKIGITPGAKGRSEVAVDNASGSLFEGDIYVKNGFSSIAVLSPSGQVLGSLDEELGPGEFAACGVAVEQSTGVVYASAVFEGVVWRFEPTSNATPVSQTNYVKTGILTQDIGSPCNLGVDTAGHVYVSAPTGGPVYSYKSSEFAAGVPEVQGTLISPEGTAIAVDSETNQAYVDEGNQVAVFNSEGELLERFGQGSMGPLSRGVAINEATKHVYVSNESSVLEFGFEIHPYTPIEDPAIVHATGQAETDNYGDFQTTADGNYAAFTSVLPITGRESNGHSEVFRYDAEEDDSACASCNPTNALVEGSSRLSSDGLGLTAAGSVFFDSNDAIAPRDLDNRQDVYEWNGTSPQLISTGESAFDSSLLGVSSDGKDAFFFTRDTLVPQDQNGTLVKIYDAREGGGFPFLPEPVPCKASDECHGASSEAPAPIRVPSITGEGGNLPEGNGTARCHKGFVRRHGHCVRRRHHRRGHHKRHGSRGGR